MGARIALLAALALCLAACRQNGAAMDDVEPLRMPPGVQHTGPQVKVAQFGQPLTLTGATLKVGDEAPDVVLKTPQGRDFRLSELRGRVVLLSVVPQLGTTVCDRSTRHFDQVAAEMDDDVAIVTVSADNPFTQDRWARENNVRHHRLLSDSAYKAFGPAYGMQVQETGKLARGVFVIDRQGVIRHIEVQQELARDPDYDAAIAAVERLQEGRVARAERQGVR